MKSTKSVKKPNKSLEYALKLLGQRSYSEKKLTEKLASREVDPEEVKKVIVRLKELGFIDDLKFAKSFVENSQAIRFNGRRKIYWQLIKKGIPMQVAKLAIEQAYADNEETDSVRKLIDKYAKNIPQNKLYERLMRRLISRGFEYGIVKQEINNYLKR